MQTQITITDIQDKLFTHEWNPGISAVAQNCESHVFGHPDTQPFGSSDPVYVNDLAVPVKLVGVDMWMGLGYNTFADLVTKIFRFSDAMVIAEYHQDRYNNPGDTSVLQKNFKPEGFTLNPGDRLVVHCLNCHVSGDDSPMHPILTFYLTKPN